MHSYQTLQSNINISHSNFKTYCYWKTGPLSPSSNCRLWFSIWKLSWVHAKLIIKLIYRSFYIYDIHVTYKWYENFLKVSMKELYKRNIEANPYFHSIQFCLWDLYFLWLQIMQKRTKFFIFFFKKMLIRVLYQSFYTTGDLQLNTAFRLTHSACTYVFYIVTLIWQVAKWKFSKQILCKLMRNYANYVWGYLTSNRGVERLISFIYHLLYIL